MCAGEGEAVMTFILRWPSILVLFAAVLLSILGAVAVAGVLTGITPPPVGVEQVDAGVAAAQGSAAAHGAADQTWLDVGLWAGAAIFFLISGIRLIRRTQAFWTWLIGFALFAGRWAYAQGQGVVDQLKTIDINSYRDPVTLWTNTDSIEAQAAVIALLLVVGIFTLIIDAADRAYWDKQGA